MLNIKIPTNTRDLQPDGTIKETPGELPAKVNVTVFAEEKWARCFPENARKETLFAYIERIDREIKKGDKKDMATVLSALKALYCVIDSDGLPTFKDFVELFDVSDDATFKKQFTVIEMAFSVALKGSAASPKN